MKRIVIAITILVCFFTVSCNFEIPKKIQIKADPTVNVSAGEVQFNVREKVNIESLQELLGEDFTVYEYEKENSDDATLRYLLKTNLLTQTFDFSEILENMNITPSMENVIPEITVAIPEMNQTIDPIAIDIPKIDVADKFSSAVEDLVIGCIKTSEDYEPVVDDENLNLNFSLSGFETIEFGANSSIILNVSTEEYPAGFGARVDNIVLKDVAGNVLVEQIVNQEIVDGSCISLDVSNKILTKDLAISFAVSTKGTLGDVVTLGVDLSITEESSIVAVSGLSDFALDAIDIPQQVISLPADVFDSAVIKEGSLVITIPQLSSLSSDYQGITRKVSLSILQENGLNLSVENWNDANSDELSFDLKNQTINSNEIIISGKIDIDVGSDIRIPQENCTAEVTAALEIKELASVTVPLQEGFENSITLNEAIPEDIKNYLYSMDFANLGFALTLNNNLPEGNDITVTVDSSVFGLSNISETFVAQKETTKDFVSQNTTIDFQNLSSFDVNVAIGLPAYDENTGTITIYNVNPNSQIALSGSVEVIFDWEKIEIAYKDGNIAGSFGGEEDSGLDLSMLSFLNETIKFDDFPLYLYAYAPGVKDVVFDASVKTMYSTEKDGEKEVVETYLVGNASQAATLKLLSNTPDFTFKEDSQTCVTSLPEGSVDPITGLTDIISAAPSDLSFDYALNLSNTITLTKEDVESLQDEPLAISLDLVLELPLAFVAYENASFNIVEILEMDSETDLFGREEPSEETLDELLANTLGENANVDFTASLKLNYNNDLGVACTLYLAKDSFVKEIALKEGSNILDVSLTRDEIADVWEMYPFNPTILLKIPGSKEGIHYALTKDSALDVTLGAQLETKIFYELSLEGEE